MAEYALVSAIDAVLAGVELQMPDTYVALVDYTTGFDGPGSYHIQLHSGAGIGGGGGYRVTYGLAPSDTSLAMTVLRVVLTPTGQLVYNDARKLNVGWDAVNQTIAQTPFEDGSCLQTGVVTTRTIAGGVIGGDGGLLDEIGATEGDMLVRGATEWEALAAGTDDYVLTSNGPGTVPSWQPSGGSSSVPHGTSFPGSPGSYELFFRDDLAALFVYNGTSWVNADSLAQLNDVAISSPANGQVLTYDSSSSKWVNAAGGGGGGGTPVAFSATATGTWNPAALNASNYYASTATIAPPSPPFLLRIRALVRVTSSTYSYYGFALSSDATHFTSIVMLDYASGGWYSQIYECSSPTSGTVEAQLASLPQNYGEYWLLELAISVQASTAYIVGGQTQLISMSPPYHNGYVDYTSPITVYAIGSAAADVASCEYSFALL
jgi:hypothetical protein